MKNDFNRRLFLKGIGGFTLSLPILEVMLNGNGDAYAAGGSIKPNYLYTFQGESSGHPKDKTVLWKPPAYGNLIKAYNQDPNHYGNSGLKHLALMGLLNDINVFSNLYINSNSPGTPGNIQVKGNPHPSAPIMHRCSNYVVNSGYGIPNNVNPNNHIKAPKGKHSCDQRIYDAIGKDGKHINFAVEKYRDDWYQSTSMRDGYIQTPQKDVGSAFDDLFGSYKQQANGNSSFDDGLVTRRSILNLVLQDHKRLKKNLGYNDRLLVDQHLSNISDLEKSIAAATSQDKLICTIPNRLSENASINIRNYGGEKERAILFNKIITLAMSCGISRVGQYTILRHKAYVDPTDYVTPALSKLIASSFQLSDCHEIGHTNTDDALKIWIEMSRWIGSVYGDLIQRFKDVPVGSGTLLDHSFIMLGMHQGIGLSLEQTATRHVHSFEDMCFLQAGGKALGAKTGNHINGQRKHPVSVSNKAAELMGLNITFGEIKDKANF